MKIKKGSRTKIASKQNIRSRRDIASVDVHDEKPSFFYILPRHSQQKVSMGCAEKDCSSCAKDVAVDVPNNDIENMGVSREKLFYEVLSMGAGTPDVLRNALHDALDTLSYF